MAILDWCIVVLFLVANVVIGLWFSRRAGKSMTEYFVAGRTIPWWLAGTSMLATSFASDTPLHNTRAIREGGLAAGWFYWGGIIGGLFVAFVFSKLWRRAGVVTDNELIELRYAGKRAAVLRGGLAIFKSFFLEILTMSWITLGMTKIVKSIMGLPDVIWGMPSDALVVVILIVLALSFSVTAGFWAVITTDMLEFTVAMVGAIVLAIIAMQKVGGIEGLRTGLAAKAPMGESALDIFPHAGGVISMFAFSVYVGVMWWGNNQIDGTGQRAQRFLACKNEKNAIAAGVWNMAVQWVIRTWPWYVTALASLVLYPDLKDHETAYPRMVADLLPIGLKGLMVASFFAAFMGTMEAHYNLTASYAINDVYKRFIKKDGDNHHYVRASRFMTLAIACVAGIVALLLTSVLGALRFKMELVAGVGLVYVLRWLWWRINATSEIAALLASVITAVTLNTLEATSGGGAEASAARLLAVVGVSALAALVATFVTKPEPRAHLVAFYLKVRPPRALWAPVAEQAGPVDSGFSVMTLVEVGVAMAFVFAGMIGLGKLILGEPVLGGALLVVGVVAGTWTIRRVLRS